ncbi:hypothetical protein HJ171_23700 [Vibrio parahaemolyticus]|jgi:hypothetical protein|uniref:hypothetical protein n=1 Tax=Vibrio TaxID=662 RepID=UPI0006A5BFD1|nr:MULTISPECIES: hypothetical protein [Vibrio harveyi group]EGQ7760027.1 hypothetical protein [Vibrio vulnificus]AVF95472.1 hypothetical protein AL552_17900 [Vibrio diabolicus]EHR7861292.1 hypothetical protein [Vibrio parahaemolyticus]EJC6932618.1 hypothetical protein [Vibrio parahaemolyticus]KOE92927.1 hypothetical protein ACS91_01470 [Vibrio parahaemolyticus]
MSTDDSGVESEKTCAEKLYKWAKPKVEVLRVLLQFVVGLFIFYTIFLKVFQFAGLQFECLPLATKLYGKAFLEIIGGSLLVSSAIELGYMLFTPGPDEAIDPLILSITASALIALSKDEAKLFDSAYLMDAAIIILFSISLTLLFYLRWKCSQWFSDMS